MATTEEAAWPRRLLSPLCVLFWVHDIDSLRALCSDNKDANMRFGNMQQLLGLQGGSSVRQQYKYGWQDFDCVRWLWHPGLARPIPVVQTPAVFFQSFRKRADAQDMDVLDDGEKLFVAFVNGNMRASSGRKKVKIPLEEARLGAADWRVQLRPEGAEALVSTVPPGSRYAKV